MNEYDNTFANKTTCHSNLVSEIERHVLHNTNARSVAIFYKVDL